tara:strand:+ start:8110 stop:9135 length:1026 start_codon:yes stop_codon:yes gene_type:complete
MEKIISNPYIIAELGGNHDGKRDYIYEGIYEAKKSGANAIKLQYYNAESLIHPNTPLMKNVKNSNTKDKNQYDRYKRLELEINEVPKFYKFAKKLKIDFGLSIFDHTKVKFLSKYTDFFKIASGDIEYFPLLREISKYKKKIFLSTGLSNLKIIDRAVKFFKKKDLVIMHCICCYPTKEEDYNLSSINLIKQKYKNLHSVGISDHTKSNIVSSISVALGVNYIEKHFLPNYKVKNVGDFSLSLNPKEFKNFVINIKKVVKIMGKNKKEKFLCEKPFEKSLRRSVYINKNIKRYEKLRKNDIKIIRPYNISGVATYEINKLIGKKIKISLKKNSLIKKSYFY